MSSTTPDSNQSTITVCGLGPGGAGHLTEATAEVLAGPHPVFLRTARHPGADRFASATSFDEVYEHGDSFDEIYRTIAESVVEAASAEGHAVYAVPGSPLILERSVRRLVEADGVEVTLLPAVSFLDEVWARLRVDPVDDGVRLVDGLRFATDAADQRGPLLVAHVHSSWVLSDIKLALDVGPEQTVTVLQRLGTQDERIFDVEWPDLDRVVEADHLTSLYIPELVAPVGGELAASVEMMHRLRQQCPWDREQSHASLRKYLLEEACEVLDALDEIAAVTTGTGEGQADEEVMAAFGELEEELGDLWFQILFHAELAAEAGQFTIADVARSLTDKMVRRHPHVYGGPEAIDGSTAANWEALKQEEKGRGSVLDGIPRSLPALALAEKIMKKADGSGSPAMFAERPEADGGPDSMTAERVGATLLEVVERARRNGISAELALREAVKRAEVRFRRSEATRTPDARWIEG